MYCTIFTIALASVALAQNTMTVNGASQIADGQVQTPSDTGIPSGPGPEIISTTLPSDTAYTNPFTSYLSMTNSLGVVTGMPSVVTSQPAVVTEQPVSPTLPSYSGYAYGNSTTTMKTMASSTSEASRTPQESAASASATVAQSTGGADMNRVAGCGFALVVLGLGFSML